MATVDMKIGYVVWYKKDFYATPVIEVLALSEESAMAAAYDLAKKKFRYTGPKRNDYQYFDQSIRIDSFPVVE